MRGQSSEPAKAICRRCAVNAECLEAALATDWWRDAGVWGGTSWPQRMGARRRGLDAETMIAELDGRR